MNKSIYDWTLIQEDYNNGLTIRELQTKYGMYSKSFQLARNRGDFVARSKKESIVNSKISKKIDWVGIQNEYDKGLTQREIQEIYGIAFASFAKAKIRGDFKSRNGQEAGILSKQKGRGGFQNLTLEQLLERDRSTSERQSLNNSGGKCKWFEVSGQKVQGTWERNVAEKFNEMDITWTKLYTNRDIIKYAKDGKICSYTPDFYLSQYNLYIELKGYWWGDDKEKMRLVMEQHPEIRIVIIEEVDYKRLLNGEIVW